MDGNKARGAEDEMETFLFANPHALEDNLSWVARQYPVNATPWLQPETPCPPWDPYRHKSKRIDLVGINGNNELVLCELKCTGGGGDDAPHQVLEYYLMLNADRPKWDSLSSLVQKKISRHCSGIALYIVVAGHVSQLLRERLQMSQALYHVPFRVFQATPPRHHSSSNWYFQSVP